MTTHPKDDSLDKPDDLDGLISNFYGWTTDNPTIGERHMNATQFKAAIEEYVRQRESAAQTNAVAWAIGVIDDMHGSELFDQQISEGGVGDKGYKGIKNTIRDRYKAECGVDPAPRYPIHAKLRPTNKEGQS